MQLHCTNCAYARHYSHHIAPLSNCYTTSHVVGIAGGQTDRQHTALQSCVLEKQGRTRKDINAA